MTHTTNIDTATRYGDAVDKIDPDRKLAVRVTVLLAVAGFGRILMDPSDWNSSAALAAAVDGLREDGLLCVRPATVDEASGRLCQLILTPSDDLGAMLTPARAQRDR